MICFYRESGDYGHRGFDQRIPTTRAAE